jgi:hypothetical protein
VGARSHQGKCRVRSLVPAAQPIASLGGQMVSLLMPQPALRSHEAFSALISSLDHVR